MASIESNKIEYLKMIQEIISRMSTISSVVKGFVVTFLAGLFSIIMSDNFLLNKYYFLFFIPLVFFIWFDIYYLALERKYRYLYELVRLGTKEVDFDLKINKKLIDIYEAKADVKSCLFSPCISIFYILIFISLCVCMWISSNI